MEEKTGRDISDELSKLYQGYIDSEREKKVR